MSTWWAVIIDLIAFTAFGFIHSYLASYGIKRKVAAKIGSYMAFYRIAYNIIALIMIWMIFEYLPRPDVELYDLPAPYDFIILIPQLLSLAGIIWTFNYFCVKEFIGISQVIKFIDRRYNPEHLDERLTLKIRGPYRITRHPLYFFTILFLIFRPTMDLFYFIFLVFAIMYFYIGSWYEEKKLIKVFGEEYIRYKEVVPSIIPYKIFSPYHSSTI